MLGLVVPTPKLLFVSSQNKLLLSCVINPLVPIKGIEPWVKSEILKVSPAFNTISSPPVAGDKFVPVLVQGDEPPLETALSTYSLSTKDLSV